MTSLACSATSLSTQPPETEPCSLPDSKTTSFEPTGLGAERRVATTVARAAHSSTRSAYRRGLRRGPRKAARCQARNDGGGADVEGERPRRAAVGPGRDPVHEREQPDREVQVVRLPPEAVRKGLPVVVRHRERNEQLGRDHAECDRDRPVGRRAGNQDVGQRERQVAVDQQRAHVDEDERPGEQADEAVHVLEREARPAGQLGLPRKQQPENDGAREQRVREDSTGALDVPDVVGGEDHAAAESSVRQAWLATMVSPARKRPASPRSSNQDRPSSESRKAAFAATSAPTQDPAATVTSSQRDSAGRPVRGSIRWCWTAPPRRHERFVLPLVAIPPASRRSVPSPARPTTEPPRTATSPPAETKASPAVSFSAASTASDLTTPLRSSTVPGGRASRRPERRSDRHLPGVGGPGGRSSSPSREKSRS